MRSLAFTSLTLLIGACPGTPLEAFGGSDAGSGPGLVSGSVGVSSSGGGQDSGTVGETSSAQGSSTTGGSATGSAATTDTAPSTSDPTTGASSESGSGDGETEVTPPSCATIPVQILDFRIAHPDFENQVGEDPGIVAHELGRDRTPVYGSHLVTRTTTGAANFGHWFHFTDGVNLPIAQGLPVVEGPTGVYAIDRRDFFPIDNLGWGNEGNHHNFHFTLALHSEFRYDGGETFEFTGDDDVWLFLNDILVLDLGGVHPAMTASVDLDEVATDVGLVVGQSYPLDLFFAERHTTESNFSLVTTIRCLGSFAG